MRLTAFTDYTLRTLMYLGTHRDKLVTIQDIADLHNISKNHLMKVVHQLAIDGVVDTVRGRHGGLRLNKEPGEINIGQVVRQTETDFYMAECFEEHSSQCLFTAACTLKSVLSEATDAYLKVLDQVSLEQLIANPHARQDKQDKSVPIALHRQAKAST